MWINKIIYMVLLIYSGILGLLYYGVATFYSFLLLLILPIFLLGALLYQKRRIQVSMQNTVTSVNQNEPVRCTIGVENKSILPVGCIRLSVSYANAYGVDYGKQNFTISMNAKSQQNIHFELKSEHVGRITIKIREVRMFDYLRLFSRRIATETETEVIILPESYLIEREVSLRQPDFLESTVYSKIKSGDDPSEVFDIREYKEGDKLHRIHWKLSSKKENILVKEYSLPIACTTAIFVDLELEKGDLGYSYMDSLLATVSSISYSLLLQECWHSIVWYEQEKEDLTSLNIGELEDMDIGIRQLLSCKPSSHSNALLEAYELNSERGSLTKVYYLTGNLTETKQECLLRQFEQAEVEVIQITSEDQGQETTHFFEQEDRVRYQYIDMHQVQTSIEALVL